MALGHCCRRASIPYSTMIGLEKKVEKGGQHGQKIAREDCERPQCQRETKTKNIAWALTMFQMAHRARGTWPSIH